jgi:hypothetical protein
MTLSSLGLTKIKATLTSLGFTTTHLARRWQRCTNDMSPRIHIPQLTAFLPPSFLEPSFSSLLSRAFFSRAFFSRAFLLEPSFLEPSFLEPSYSSLLFSRHVTDPSKISAWFVATANVSCKSQNKILIPANTDGDASFLELCSINPGSSCTHLQQHHSGGSEFTRVAALGMQSCEVCKTNSVLRSLF